MKIFISWSGERSRAVAEILRTWLKDILQMVDPWVSSEDIRMGARWSFEVAQKLEEACFGILCLTRENLSEPWLLFEAGALAKTLDKALVCPLLIDLKPSELNGPLVQFQAARAVESDMRNLVHSINKALDEASLPAEQIDRVFRKWWPELEEALGKVQGLRQPTPTLRSDRELLEEILDRVRHTISFADPGWKSPRWMDKLDEFSRGLFEGSDIEALIPQLEALGIDGDPNSSAWNGDMVGEGSNVLDGRWASRWEGGTASGKWVTGVGQLQCYGEYVYVITHDPVADCLIATRRISKDRLAGRYINLADPREILAWVGRIVTPERIDGLWTQGRWDLRRTNDNT